MRHPHQAEGALAQALRDLAGLDAREVASYDAVIERLPLDAEADRSGLVAIRDEHRRHAARLRLLVLTLGCRVERPDQRCPMVTRGRIAVAALLGGDVLLATMKREEARVTCAYLKAMARGLPARVHDAMEPALREQLAHGAWFEDAIEQRRRARRSGAGKVSSSDLAPPA